MRTSTVHASDAFELCAAVQRIICLDRVSRTIANFVGALVAAINVYYLACIADSRHRTMEHVAVQCSI